MTKSAEYMRFEEGFLKEAAAQGMDVPFLQGMISEAEEKMDMWATTFKTAEEMSGDPQFRVKLANEIVRWCVQQPLVKTSEFDWSNILNNPDVQGLFSQIGGGNQTMGGAIGGGAGGGLLGLLLGMLTGNPMMGLMLGGLGGAGLGGLYGSRWLQNKFAPNAIAPETPPDSVPLAPELKGKFGPPATTPTEIPKFQAPEVPQLNSSTQSMGNSIPEVPITGAQLPQEDPSALSPQPAGPEIMDGRPSGAPIAPELRGTLSPDIKTPPAAATPTPNFQAPKLPPVQNVPTQNVEMNNIKSLNVPSSKGMPVPPYAFPKPPIPAALKPQGPGMSALPPKVGEVDQEIEKLADMMQGMQGPSAGSALGGPVYNNLTMGGGVPGTTARNPLLPIGAPVVQGPNQDSVTPGGSLMTTKKPMKEVF